MVYLIKENGKVIDTVYYHKGMTFALVKNAAAISMPKRNITITGANLSASNKIRRIA